MDQSTDAPASTRERSRLKPATKPTAATLKKCSCSAPASKFRGIPASTPRYSSFRNIRNPKVRRAKEYEQHLRFLQDAFPEYATGLEDDLAYAISQQERGRVSDRDRIFKHIGDTPLSCREVCEDLSIPYATTYKILNEFADKGLMIITEREGRGGKTHNKPTLYYQRSSPHGSL